MECVDRKLIDEAAKKVVGDDIVDSLLGNYLVCHQGTGTFINLEGCVLINADELSQEENDFIDEAGEVPDSAYEYGVDMTVIVDSFFNNQ
jgi:hypothetical protein